MDVARARETIAAQRPRRLRLDELLRELGARGGDAPGGDEPPAAALADGSHARLRAGHGAGPRPEQLTVGELVDKAAEAGFGFLIGVLALIAIPFFGLSTPFGLAIALIGAQMMIGRAQPWLPRRARARALRMTMLDRVLAILARRTRWLARSTRRRWEIMLHGRVIGLGVVLLALGLALPLPIPGSNIVFLLPLFIYAVGLLERDGAWVAVAHACTLINVALMFAFGRTVVVVLERAWQWIA